MLQETADHRAHPDRVRLPLNCRRQQAGTAHNQIDLHTRLPRGHQGFDQGLIGERIHLQDDARVLPVSGRLGGLRNPLAHARVQMKRRDQQLLHPAQRVLAGQVPKQLVHVGSDACVGGQEADVGVQARGARVVVAGRQMAVAAQALAFAPGHQQHLGVGLEAHHAVDHLHPDGFQLLGPVDVGLFVKAGLEFHHGRHFLAPAHRLAQQIQHHRVAACAVDGLLDGQHIGVPHGLAQKGQHAVKAFEGLVDHHILLAQVGQDRGHPLQLQW